MSSSSVDSTTPGLVGVVGLGVMGSLIAGALHERGRQVVVFDANPTTAAKAAQRGVLVVDSVEEVAGRCGVVVLSLPTPDVVRTVVEQLGSGRSAPVVLDTSTIGPDTAQECQQSLSEAGGDYADCPILGRPSGVGSWTIPVGGSQEAASVAEETLQPVARRVLRVGEVGTAATLKVLNNLMLGAINAVTAEVLVLSEAAGLDPGVFIDTIVDSGAASVSGLFKDVGPRAVAGDFEPTFSLGLMRKDNGLALALADRHNVPMPVGSAAQMLNTMAVASGFGDQDSIAVVKLLEQMTGHRVRRHQPTQAEV